MAEFDYQEIVDVTDELLAEFGTTVTITRVEYIDDPASMDTVQTETSIETLGVLLSYEIAERSNNLIELTDQKLIISASELDFEPSPGDRVSIEGENWRVISVTRIRPATVTVAYEIQVRR